MSLRPVTLLLPLLALAACDREASETIDPRPQPVLPGTVSDAMLHTEQLQAQAPLAEPTPTGEPGSDTGFPDIDEEQAGSERAAPQRRRDRDTRVGDDEPARPADPRTPAAKGEPAASPSPRATASPRPTSSPRPSPTP